MTAIKRVAEKGGIGIRYDVPLILDQKIEAEADKAKKTGKVIGNGTAKGLLEALKF